MDGTARSRHPTEIGENTDSLSSPSQATPDASRADPGVATPTNTHRHVYGDDGKCKCGAARKRAKRRKHAHGDPTVPCPICDDTEQRAPDQPPETGPGAEEKALRSAEAAIVKAMGGGMAVITPPLQVTSEAPDGPPVAGEGAGDKASTDAPAASTNTVGTVPTPAADLREQERVAGTSYPTPAETDPVIAAMSVICEAQALAASYGPVVDTKAPNDDTTVVVPSFICPEPVRFSFLRLLGQRSPAHFAGTSAELDETAAMERGSAVHAMLLGGAPVLCYPRRRAGKDWDAFEADHPDALILTETEYNKAVAMAVSVRRTPFAEAALDGIRETPILWTRAGVACRSTPDVRTDKRVVDLKTTRTAHPDEFTRLALSRAYHGQLAWTEEGMKALKLGVVSERIIVAVESVPPFVCQLFRFTDRAMEAGQKLVAAWFERLLVCRATGMWPPYLQRIAEIDVPEEGVELTFAGDETQASEE